ncbi:Zn(II)2Cys6 transcription factor [Phanerochaete sordida]|uniref:Zn(II)2Cys6 transcription factor n=1 Tax=Phanerochaete sordida TaxID=48140 RepID=A0A9P3FY16_9APHY|nr:Zn(II)2Cys6 transcription factor [Phanerochaete sordida]
MASEASKSPTEQPAHPQPPQAIAPYPPPYGAHYAPLPPGAYPPPFYTFAPIPDPNHDPNAAPNGAPPPQPYIMIPQPGMMPGMVYAYAPPPPGQVLPYPPYPAPPQVPTVAPRPKRKQVKMACTNCAAACKRCDDSRPCERCQKYGLGESCVDGQRKERKKGIKRGPYKRKAKSANGEGMGPSTSGPEGEASVVPTPYGAPPPEAYYPYYYPHPPYAPPPHDGQAHGEAAANGSAHPVPQTYFPLHPAVYPPYPPYGHPPPVPYAAPPAVISPPPPDANPKSPQAAESVSEAPSKSKKKTRAKAGEGAAKGKAAAGASDTNGVEPHDGAPNGYQATTGQSFELPGGGSGTDTGHMVSPV